MGVYLDIGVYTDIKVYPEIEECPGIWAYSEIDSVSWNTEMPGYTPISWYTQERLPANREFATLEYT